MTERENYLRLISGKEPAWVPRYSIAQISDPKGRYTSCVAGVGASFILRAGGAGNAGGPSGGIGEGTYRDMFGVEYTTTESTGGMALPTPNHFILDDIRKWRDVIKVPDLSNIDWEANAKKDTEHINREEQAVSLSTHIGYFQHLMNFMGFTEGLCAMYEEPDEVLELYEYLADFYETVTRNYIKYVKPDILSISDDTATALNPFISPEMYRRLVKPYHARLGQIAMDYGIPCEMHNCGRCEDMIEDWREFGVRVWNPAQVMNDLSGIKAKYGNSLVLCGCWDSQGPAGWPGAPEELVRSEVRKCIDTFAPGGGFIFWGSTYGQPGDEELAMRAEWMTDEYVNYGRTFYQRQG